MQQYTCNTQGWDSQKNITEGGGGGGGSKRLRISFLEAMYSFRVSFLSLSIFLGYEFDVMAISGLVCTFC